MASLIQHSEALATAWQHLDRHWQTTSEQWRDATQRDFEQQYWVPLAQQVRLTQRELANLIQVLERVQHGLR